MISTTENRGFPIGTRTSTAHSMSTKARRGPVSGFLCALYLLFCALTATSVRAQDDLEALGDRINQHILQRQTDQAAPLLDTYIAKTKERYGPKDERYAIALAMLGYLQIMRAQYAAAEATFKDAEEILGAQYPRDDPHLSSVDVGYAELRRRQGRFQEAEPYARAAFEKLARVIGSDSPLLAPLAGTIADTLREVGRFREADVAFQRAAELIRPAAGNFPPHVVGALLNNWGLNQMALGAYREAEQTLGKALEVRKLLGADHPEVAQTENNLASVYQVMGRFEEAEKTFKSAITRLERAPSESQADLANAIGNLASLHQELSRFAEAQDGFAKALKIAGDHPGANTFRMNLAQIYQSQGRTAEASALISTAREGIIAAYGPASPKLALLASLTARRQIESGNFEAAKTSLDEAYALVVASQGAESPPAARILAGQAGLASSLDQLGVAETLLLRAFEIANRVSGPNSLDIAMYKGMLGDLYRAQGRDGEAEVNYREALQIAQAPFEPKWLPRPLKVLGVTMPEWFGRAATRVGLRESDVRIALPSELSIMLYERLGLLAMARGDRDEAEQILLDTVAAAEALLGANSPATAQVLQNLAVLYERQDREKDAEALYLRSLRILKDVYGPDNQYVAIVSSNLGGFYKLQDRNKERAELLLQAALRFDEATFGAQAPIVGYDLTQLGDLYRVLGRCDVSETYFSRAATAGVPATQAVPVFYGTDRKQDPKQRAITFTSDSASGALSLGRAYVSVPKEQFRALLSVKAGERGLDAQVTKPIRMAVSCPQAMTQAELLAAAAKPEGRYSLGTNVFSDQALVFIHGFTVSHDDALRRAAQLAFDLKFDGPTFVFTWPAKSELLDYFRANRSAISSSRDLRAFLESVLLQTGARRVHIIAHSMGNTVLITAIGQMLQELPSTETRLGEIIFAAPDADGATLATVSDRLPKAVRRLTLYASAEDRALWLSSRLWGKTRAGFIGDAPLIATGVDTIDITRAGMSLFALNHDVYASNTLIISDMRKILEKGTRPPNVRTDAFEAVTQTSGRFWRIKALSRSERGAAHGR